MKISQNLVVKRTRRLLAVTGNKGNGISLVDQLHGSFHLPALHLKFPGQCLNNVHDVVSFFRS